MQTTQTLSPHAAERLHEGQQALERGAFKEGLVALIEAFSLAPHDHAVQNALLEVLSCTSGYRLPTVMTDILTKASIERGHNTQALAMLLKNQIDNSEEAAFLATFLPEASLDSLLEEDIAEKVVTLFSDILLQSVLTHTTAISDILETILTALRSHFLFAYMHASKASLEFLSTYRSLLPLISCQAYTTEYIFDLSAEEQALLERMVEDIIEDPESTGCVEIALIGAYQPLLPLLQHLDTTTLEGIIQSLTDAAGAFPLMWRTLYIEPMTENILKADISVLSPLSSGFSEEVASQYEAFPYPRWQSARLANAHSLKSLIENRFGAEIAKTLPDHKAKTLYAGCGTGQQIVSWESLVPSEKALAVDISKTSLAYAQRKLQDYALPNLHIGQADILAMADWDATFDLIICTGVLHHMENPLDGLKALKAVSHENTIFHIALYSKRGRGDVIAARELITNNGIADSLEGLRQMRALLKSLHDTHPAKPIKHCREFYSASGLHDYIFNLHEIRFSPFDVKTLLEAAGLTFLGFELSNSHHADIYKSLFPDDPSMTNLENWDIFEDKHPEIFTDMMHFWCKPA